ncbi:hypothetical protein Q7P37_000639 [Cladosporium fusiforme]
MAGLLSLPRTTPVLIRRVAFHNPASSGPAALQHAIQALTSTSNASRTITLNRSKSSAILSYCYSTSSKPSALTNSPAHAFTAPVTPDCSNETLASAARSFATTASMDPHEVDKESKEGLNDWKLRPPYNMHEHNDNFNARYDAACHCGKVEYQLSRQEPLDSKLCHCTTCQTQHAAPFQWAAIFHKDDISFKNGHHNLEWYDPSTKSTEHRLPCKVRCSYCHSPIMDEGRNMILLFPSLIKFQSQQEKENFAPRCHMFYGQRCIDIPDGLPKWTGLNKDSDLIEDSPPEQVKELVRQREKERKERFEKGQNE